MTGSHIRKEQKHALRASFIEPIVSAGDETVGMKFSYNIHGKRIAVLFSHDAPPEYDQRETSVPAEYIDRYDQAGWWLDGETESTNPEKRLEALTEEMEQVIRDICYDMLMELAGPAPEKVLLRKGTGSGDEVFAEQSSAHNIPPSRTLHEYMYPDTFVVQVVSQDEQLKGIRRDDVPPPTRWPAHPKVSALENEAKAKVPVYTPSQIRIIKSFMFHPWILLVSTPDEKLLCCKLSSIHPGAFEREYSILRKMYDAGCINEILHVPQLKGLVRTDGGHGEEGIVGLLMDHVDTECYELTFHLAPQLPAISAKNKDISTEDLNDNDLIPKIDSHRREKWSSQIQSTLHQLHALDIVWGDAKTANILLDRNDDLWMIDFGGGGTPGWFDKKLMGTKQGDLQALERILDEIRGKRRVWRSDQPQPMEAEENNFIGQISS